MYPDPHWSPAPLPLNTPPDSPQATSNPATTPDALSHARREPAHQRSTNLAVLVRAQKRLPRHRLPRRHLPRRPRGSRQAAAQPHDGSSCYGGHDGHDEGECGHDGPADSHHGVDQRFLLGICHQCVDAAFDAGTKLLTKGCSEIAVSAHAAIQVHAAVRCWNQGSGCQMGQQSVVVFLDPVWIAARLQLHPGQQWYVTVSPFQRHNVPEHSLLTPHSCGASRATNGASANGPEPARGPRRSRQGLPERGREPRGHRAPLRARGCRGQTSGSLGIDI